MAGILHVEAAQWITAAVNGLCLSVVVVGAPMLLGGRLRSFSAATRYGVWWAVFTVTALLPFAPLFRVERARQDIAPSAPEVTIPPSPDSQRPEPVAASSTVSCCSQLREGQGSPRLVFPVAITVRSDVGLSL